MAAFDISTPHDVVREALQVTQGSLSVHLRRLEKAAGGQIETSFRGSKPLTGAGLSRAGRRTFAARLGAMGRPLGEVPT